MFATSPEHAVELMDQAFNQGDLEELLSFYEDAAVVVTEAGKVARGPADLRAFFAQAIRSGLSANQLKTYVIETDGIALFLSRWTLSSAGDSSAAVPRTFIATSVFRKQSDGNWKVLIDNPFGALVLGPK
ncbi:MAG TPA: DUF4440 domain-containing protein [Terracidiphilus sp.]|nr:DUF4440 domain-containing protein [Terracidiphilus sp.]